MPVQVNSSVQSLMKVHSHASATDNHTVMAGKRVIKRGKGG